MLDDIVVRGAYRNEINGLTCTYYICLRSMYIILGPNKVRAVIEEVFNNLAMKVIMESDQIENYDATNLIYGLRKSDYIHFEKFRPMDDITSVK